MTPILRLLALLSFSFLAACAGTSKEDAPPATLAGYEAVEDEGFLIQPVEARHLSGGREKAEVAYAGPEAAGTIVVDTFARKLYYVMEGGRAMRYSIAVGREGISFRGAGVIGRMEKWPSWQPTANMVRTRPDLYAAYAGGLPGGLENPLGARAMYLYRGGRDSMFRIHGTVQNATIGHATSAGCIRLFNQDAIDLYNRISHGTRVKVRSFEESLALEGPYMDDAWGLAVPETPENIARLEADKIVKAEQEAAEAAAAIEAAANAEIDAAKAAEEAEKADKKRLAACKRKKIAAEDCPVIEVAAAG
jgi:lipoprotein-anchoring transpeptidase ErfK/SrfK